MMSIEARGIDPDTTVSRVRICLLSAFDLTVREDNESCRYGASRSSQTDFSLAYIIRRSWIRNYFTHRVPWMPSTKAPSQSIIGEVSDTSARFRA